MIACRTLLLTALLLAAAGPISAAEYFVAPDGDDANSGTLEAPFASIQNAQNVVAAGDTVWIRGGTYRIQPDEIDSQRRIWAHVIHLRKSGEEDKPIRYFAYQQEQPIFDFTDVKPEGRRVHAFSVDGSWIHLRGIEVIGVQVTMTGHTQSICFANNGSHNIFERLSMHDGHAIGIYSVRGSDNLFLNCDAYRNHDPVSQGGRGGNVDGFGCHPTPGSTGNVFRGCRAWLNSDDGFDCITASEAVRFEDCWAFWNGYSPEFKSLADGNGFKAGGYGTLPAHRLPREIPVHVVQNCMAVRNKASGFYANHHPGGSVWVNNTAYRNGTNFNMLCRLANNTDDVDGYGHVLKNNLSYGSRRDLINIDESKCELEANSFDLNLEISPNDFLDLKEDQHLTLPRQTDGSLPVIRFLHLSPESQLIDRGVPVELPYQGKAPDLGAFESTAD
ncbi:right-handed parallel beta-helix repeat-containing protein [Bremerella cremea]|uniref:right-handed parallel beta-helix repeat-containing protein n=1 Tax=Bremerella cremea TaxID=1031537 RepID=UPI0031ED94AC